MPVIQIETDKTILQRLEQISVDIRDIKNDMKFLKSTGAVTASELSREWLNAPAFCRAFHISRPTLKSRVEKGLVEVRTFGDINPRYRWLSGKEENNAEVNKTLAEKTQAQKEV